MVKVTLVFLKKDKENLILNDNWFLHYSIYLQKINLYKILRMA
jgi:hypothetical protein